MEEIQKFSYKLTWYTTGLITAHSRQHSTGRNTDIGVHSTTTTVQYKHATLQQHRACRLHNRSQGEKFTQKTIHRTDRNHTVHTSTHVYKLTTFS